MANKNQFSTNTGLTVLPEFPQTENPAIWQDLLAIRQAIKSLQGTLDLYTGALTEDVQYWGQVAPAQTIRTQFISRLYVKASEAISYGQLVHLWNDGGICKARLASATDATKPTRAYCTIPAGVAAGAFGEFNVLGASSIYSGLVPGTPYYMAVTPGAITAVAPSGGGNLVQPVGYALSTTTLYFNPRLP